MRYWKQGIVVGACAVACTAPLLFGTAAAGLGAAGLGLLGWGEVGMAAALAAVGGGFLVWRSWRTPSHADLAAAACGCAATAGCSTGSACDVPETTPPHHGAKPPLKTLKERISSIC